MASDSEEDVKKAAHLKKIKDDEDEAAVSKKVKEKAREEVKEKAVALEKEHADIAEAATESIAKALQKSQLKPPQ